MRYFNCMLNANSESIQKNTKIRLKDYDYSSTVAALNAYMYSHLENGHAFLVYREEKNRLLAIFAFDEKRYTYQEACDHYADILSRVFGVEKMKEESVELTMQEYLDYLYEARRREYNNRFLNHVDNTNLWIYYIKGDHNDERFVGYEFSEKIISEDKKKSNTIYDAGFLKELNTIDTHDNTSEYSGNMVHYVISGRSMEAASDMTETLMQHLRKANRIRSRRMEIVREIHPQIFKKDNHLEDTIENNYGGVIVIDLSARFGHSSTEYGMAAKYIEGLVKRYRNECLFVFTYNMDDPGFAYSVLPNLKKYVIPVTLREGTGDRRQAVAYMKALIKESDYAEYANQATEFMKQYPGETFTQTDVLMAYEQFEAWCLNKNVLRAYDCDITKRFLLDRDENTESSYEKLQKMIGLDTVKHKIDDIIAENIIEKERRKRVGKKYNTGTMHMIFGGNPGSAKTTVAKLFAGIAKEKGILPSGAFVERGGMDLDGLMYVAAIRDAFSAAKGGVLFIDEAYSMKSDGAVTVLIQEMENHRDDVIVILAGYNERMQEFMNINEGLKSRIPHWVDFPDYNAEELTDIFRLMVKERGFCVEEDAVEEARYIFGKVHRLENFGNGRYVRNLLDRAVQQQSVRLLAEKKNTSALEKSELFLIKKKDISALKEDAGEGRPAGSAKKELAKMIGLSGAKEVLNKAIASHKLKKLCLEKGIRKENASMHMVFTGNPGTAKTTVARLFTEIMKDEAVLSTGRFVEVGRADLVGQYVGHTAPLVKKKFKDAQGGVLFIDEAYSLCDSYENGFGDEAIDTIVHEMENHRDDVIVIFAGYPEPMKQFLDRNPGMQSRIAFQIEFEDYTTEELCAITKLMLTKKQLTITEAAMNRLEGIYDAARKSSDYGNGRFVRKMIEEAEMNLAERIMGTDQDSLTLEAVSTIEESDIPEYRAKKIEKMPIGF